MDQNRQSKKNFLFLQLFVRISQYVIILVAKNELNQI